MIAPYWQTRGWQVAGGSVHSHKAAQRQPVLLSCVCHPFITTKKNTSKRFQVLCLLSSWLIAPDWRVTRWKVPGAAFPPSFWTSRLVRGTVRRWRFWWLKYLCNVFLFLSTQDLSCYRAAPSIHSENNRKKHLTDHLRHKSFHGGRQGARCNWVSGEEALGSFFCVCVFFEPAAHQWILLFKNRVNNPLVTPSIIFKISQLLAHLPQSHLFSKRKSPSLFSVCHMETPACPWSSLTLLCFSPDGWMGLLALLESVEAWSWDCS